MAPRQAHEHDPLVGRADELGSLGRVLDELDAGQPGAIELVGELGIGKTRLLVELATRAELRRHLVLAGSASEFERDLPLSVFVDALDEYVEGLDPSELAALDEDVQAELAHVLPSLSALGRGREVALQQERYRSHRAVRALLEQLAQTRPLVLVLDDFHWADSGSVELLGALLRRPPAAPVLTAVALRPRQTPGRLSAALERAHRAAKLNRIELGALTPEEARELLGEAVDSAGADVLYRESGGNPFYLEQLSRALERAGGATSAPDISLTGLEVPRAVAASLSEELALLSAGGRLVLEGAAVAGDPFEPELAAAAAATSEAAAMDAVDELLQLDLIRSTDVPRRFRFRHPLVWRAVYEATAGGWRLGAHERCAEALTGMGVTAAGRAHHVERSAHKGDLAAVGVLREAGEATARLAPSSAVRWFGAALRLLPETAPSEERVVLLLARASSLAATGRFAESHADLLTCIEIAPRDWRVRVTTACATVERLLGLQTEAHSHLTTALADLRGAESAEAVELMIELTVDALFGGDVDAMRSWAARAVAAATPLGERALLAAALAVRAWAGAFVGEGDQAQAHCDEATELVDELSYEELAQRLDTLVHLASADLYLDRFAAATRHAQRALDIGRATGRGDLFPPVVAMLGGSLWVQGKPLEAEELFDGAVEAARLAGNVHSLAWTLFNRSIAALVAGKLDVALATAEESFELAEDMEPGLISALAAAVLASALFETGQPDRCIDLLLTRAGGEELQLIGGGWRARFLEVLTRALLATGRQAEAERAAASAQACADAVALPSAAAMASLAAAALALDAGRPAAAAERALAAAAALESVAALFDAARARELAGRALAQAGDRDRAALELELAAASFDSFGSLRYRNQAERELRKLGRHVHRRTRPGTPRARDVTALTAREFEIAQLVVDRKTNPQIAAELFLSQKTVETHLRNIFRKIDVSTRIELARVVEHADGGARATSRDSRSALA
ncbi:MAG TPA: AAA family ATPase [Gaiellaceae bacterium]|nr:AAA family ATPase [Gaiellaceae bacterium]